MLRKTSLLTYLWRRRRGRRRRGRRRQGRRRRRRWGGRRRRRGCRGAGERGSHGECGGVGGSGGGVAGGSGGDGGGVYSYYLLTYLLEARGATWRAVAWSSQLALAFICSILIGSSSLEGALGSETWPRPGPARACSVVGPERRTSAMLLGVAARLERLSL